MPSIAEAGYEGVQFVEPATPAPLVEALKMTLPAASLIDAVLAVLVKHDLPLMWKLIGLLLFKIIGTRFNL